MRDIQDELEELKREILESRTLIIKTHNASGEASAELRRVSDGLRMLRDRFRWNNGVVYTLFAILAFVGIKLWADVRVGELKQDVERLQSQLRSYEEEQTAQADRLARRQRAERETLDFLKTAPQTSSGDRIKKYEQLKKLSLSSAEGYCVESIVEDAKKRRALESFQEGQLRLREQRFKNAEKLFNESLELAGQGDEHVPKARLGLAEVYLAENRNEEAKQAASEVLDKHRDVSLHDDATLVLAKVALKDGDRDRARVLLRTILQQYPKSQYRTEAWKLLTMLTPGAGMGASVAPSDPASTAAPPAVLNAPQGQGAARPAVPPVAPAQPRPFQSAPRPKLP